MGLRFDLDAREYKLLLDPKWFATKTPRERAARLWDKKLKPIIEDRLDPRKSGKPRHEAGFSSSKTRMVRFYDAVPWLLAEHDYAFRERMPVAAGEPDTTARQVTLKLRMPDLFVVAAVAQEKPPAGAEVKLEEDIAPLAGDEGTKRRVVLAAPRSIRSRFALSTTLPARALGSFRTIGDIMSAYPTLRGNLVAAGAGPTDKSLRLRAGPDIREIVWRGATVDLGQGIAGQFALTLWYFGGATAPQVAEISYRCETRSGSMPGNSARRALALFIAMQDDLGDMVERGGASKTALALPR